MIYRWPDGGRKSDSRLVNNMLFGLTGGTDVIAELRERGYDVTTLRFTIRLKEREKG